MEESEVSAATNYQENDSWGIAFLVISYVILPRGRPPQLHKKILGEFFS